MTQLTDAYLLELAERSQQATDAVGPKAAKRMEGCLRDVEHYRRSGQIRSIECVMAPAIVGGITLNDVQVLLEAAAALRQVVKERSEFIKIPRADEA